MTTSAEIRVRWRDSRITLTSTRQYLEAAEKDGENLYRACLDGANQIEQLREAIELVRFFREQLRERQEKEIECLREESLSCPTP